MDRAAALIVGKLPSARANSGESLLPLKGGGAWTPVQCELGSTYVSWLACLPPEYQRFVIVFQDGSLTALACQASNSSRSEMPSPSKSLLASLRSSGFG